MTLRMSALCGVTLALTITGCQADTETDVAPKALASVQGTGGGIADGWRALPAVGWALDEWEDALDRFGDLVELLPQPADFLCDHASERDVLLRLRCEYWDRFKDHLDGDDEHDEHDEHDDEHDDDHDAERGRGDWSDDDVRGGNDDGADGWSSASDDEDSDRSGASGLGG